MRVHFIAEQQQFYKWKHLFFSEISASFYLAKIVYFSLVVTLYVHSTLANVNKRIGEAKVNLKIHASESTDSYIYAMAKGATFTILEEVSSWHRVSLGAWRNAKVQDVRTYLNPTNFVNDEKQRFQFPDLSRLSGLSVTVLNTFSKVWSKYAI
ncbi:hypothetical protein CWR48_00475 [Oceanobacillus arenosus]|uniref:SH3b domain-containing protein n=1 Tax=Oceanobacillus arenosus TaxID=1229153 RepID=A0A3D8Q478_9BACI|nr:hypothetical protein [Oceanobacillus arenosus]RDW22215.1 hypothetical protein CWR48_00475 [Oceanobacillus arenosus]